ncbi:MULTISPECIES: hypothetical protein [unclassified Corallococcus]|uniref:hypothetical protein n=1 Tax=unclassified Corallococcus TaxID=2685029 RepID=UPI001A8D6B53|nr:MULTISPECIES: hypothetical protein [unclassified Corallococcus]MBN9685298.1 hypothetical protein [Corallococcus sp. NCSPR001]WAS83249.1 hypothetical protein O0N60_28510 [Corallococcus sp. NCRR]
MVRSRSVLFAAVLVAFTAGCASQRLSGADLDRVQRPAFISRIEDGAGPKSKVFQEDSAYSDKLKKLEPKEADRRLTVKLQQAVTRFELSERLRVTTLSRLPEEAPWTDAVDPARVASALESFLVEEVPANAPDYDLMAPLGADTIVEFVIQDYGMRSDDGHAGAYLKGYGRMFRLDGRSELWRRPFDLDAVEQGAQHLDPFKVGKEPELFRLAMTDLLDKVADMFVKDLTPKNRKGAAPSGSTAPDTVPSAVTPSPAPAPTPPEQQLPPGELPDPDA